MSRSRGYCFTCNNYSDVQISQLMDMYEEGLATYVVFGFEIAPTTGTHHLQGYIHFKDAKTMKYVYDRIDRISLIEAKAKGEQYDRRYLYCMKDGDFYEVGDRPQDGANTSSMKVMASINEGKTYDELKELYPSFMLYHKQKVQSWIAERKPTYETKFYVMKEPQSIQESIQLIHEHFGAGTLEDVAVVTELSELKAYDTYKNVIYLCDTYDKKQVLWPYGAPISFKYGYEHIKVNCERFIIVTPTVKFYNNYKKINT